jgi:transglutaminase-like putative cysteine protease
MIAAMPGQRRLSPFRNYNLPGCWDEMFAAPGEVRPQYQALEQGITSMPPEEMKRRKQDNDRSDDGATHAWVECWMPGLGWAGFDPANNLLAGERHIRTAIGRGADAIDRRRGSDPV